MPVKDVHVRDHDRRKPLQQQQIHVDDYHRRQDVSRGPPPGREELGPREMTDLEKVVDDIGGNVQLLGKNLKDEVPAKSDEELLESVENYPDVLESYAFDVKELPTLQEDPKQMDSVWGPVIDTRTCEDCGKELPAEEMQRFSGGWYCRDCSIDQEVEQVESIEKELHPEPHQRPPEKGWKRRGMKLLTKADEKKLPKLYATESVPVEDKVLRVKFFTPTSSWTWYAVEFDGEDTFFGYIEGHEKEWGYFSLSELSEVKGPLGIGVERDKHWTPRKFGDYLGGT